MPVNSPLIPKNWGNVMWGGAGAATATTVVAPAAALVGKAGAGAAGGTAAQPTQKIHAQAKITAGRPRRPRVATTAVRRAALRHSALVDRLSTACGRQRREFFLRLASTRQTLLENGLTRAALYQQASTRQQSVHARDRSPAKITHWGGSTVVSVATVMPLERTGQDLLALSGIGFQPVMPKPTGWKPMPLCKSDS